MERERERDQIGKNAQRWRKDQALQEQQIISSLNRPQSVFALQNAKDANGGLKENQGGRERDRNAPAEIDLTDTSGPRAVDNHYEDFRHVRLHWDHYSSRLMQNENEKSKSAALLSHGGDNIIIYVDKLTLEPFVASSGTARVDK